MEISIANQLFYKLCSEFDLEDTNIMRRLVHGFETAQNCFSLASSENIIKQDREFLYCVGLLHDTGRLVQWREFESFSDSQTAPHELLGVEFLKQGWISRFFVNKDEQKLALKLIEYHTKNYSGKDEKMKKFLTILKDADCYANLSYTACGLQRLWLKQNGVSSQVLSKFRLRESLHGTEIRTKLDRVLQLLSRAYAIKHNILKRDLLARKYINSIFEVYEKQLNKLDREILIKECWVLKREISAQVAEHDIEKQKLFADQN